MNGFLRISFVPILLATALRREEFGASADAGRKLYNRFHGLQNGHAGP